MPTNFNFSTSGAFVTQAPNTGAGFPQAPNAGAGFPQGGGRGSDLPDLSPAADGANPSVGDDEASHDFSLDKIAQGFNNALETQKLAFRLSERNKSDDVSNKAALKGIDNAGGYV